MAPFTRAAAALIPIAISFMPAPASAQTYPAKPLRFLVGFAPGGGTDIMARAVGQKLSEALGQQVVVENRPGANGNIAGEAVARAPADGYTILMISVSHAVNVSLYRKLSYDPLKDFTPVIAIGSVILELGDIKERLASLGAQPMDGSPGQFDAYIKSEVAKFAKVVKDANLQVD